MIDAFYCKLARTLLSNNLIIGYPPIKTLSVTTLRRNFKNGLTVNDK